MDELPLLNPAVKTDVKKKLFYNYTDFVTMTSLGNRWLGEIIGYFPIGGWLQSASVYQIAIWAIGSINFWFIHFDLHFIQFWMILVYLAVKFYFKILFNYFGGKLAVKIGLLRATQNYQAKAEHIAPYEAQNRRTIINIAEAVGAKSEFTEL